MGAFGQNAIKTYKNSTYIQDKGAKNVLHNCTLHDIGKNCDIFLQYTLWYDYNFSKDDLNNSTWKQFIHLHKI